MSETTEKSLVVLEQEQKSLEGVFTAQGIEPILKRVRELVVGQDFDVSTAKGRKQLASLANKVARTKTYLDDLGKEFVSDLKAKCKVVDESRKIARDYLDNLKEEVRKPLTEWEQAEEARVKEFEDTIAKIIQARSLSNKQGYRKDLAEMEDDLKAILELPRGDFWQEFIHRAEREMEESIAKLKAMIDEEKKRIEEKAEFERLKAEEAERKKKEEQERIKREFEEKARLEAEAKAKAEIETKEREKIEAQKRQQEAEEREKRAIKEKEEAEARAEEAKRKAIEEERARIEQQEKAKAEEQKKREADIEHRKRINNDALKSLVVHCGLTEDQAKGVVKAIASGLVPAVKINY